ncbi:MAG: hypothetical protein RMJ83_09335 [Armatimonadota bacterium]|nr:hypothetical protein [Armatimonadota bacterium]
MFKRNNPVLVVGLIAVIILAVVALVWQIMRSASPPAGEIPASAYPQPTPGQPTVEEVGPPPDVVPARGPATPPPFKGGH